MKKKHTMMRNSVICISIIFSFPFFTFMKGILTAVRGAKVVQGAQKLKDVLISCPSKSAVLL